MREIKANNIIKTLNWIIQTNDEEPFILEPVKGDEGLYRCVIHLSLVDKTIIGLGKDKLESIDNATSQSSIQISNYVENHPDVVIEELLNTNDYILQEDDEVNLSIHKIKRRENC